MTTKRFASFVIALSMVLGVGCGSGGDGVSSLVWGEHEFTYNVNLNHVTCESGQWTADVTLECWACEGTFKNVVPPTAARIYLWEFTENQWSAVDTLSLKVDAEKSHTVDLTAHGVSCDDVATALAWFPIGAGYYGDPKFSTLNRGASWGGGYGGGPTQTKFQFSCDPAVAVRADLTIYNYRQMKSKKTFAMNPPPAGETGLKAKRWTFEGPTPSPSTELVVFLGYDAQDNIQCARFQ